MKQLEQGASVILGPDLTRISNKLHRRNRFAEASIRTGLLIECLLFTTSILSIGAESSLVRLISIVLLALCLQPLIKTSAGLLVGVRYSYVYLWYFEPRFKMQFGTYQKLERWKKIVVQLLGSIGTPLALFIGWAVLSDEPLLSVLLLASALAATLMQVTAFVAVWLGARRLGPFLLSNLTTPALLAKELKGRH